MSTTAETAPTRVAVIFAHPDDAEFICSGTVARWAAEGRHVTYVLVTNGNKGSSDPTMTPERLVEIRTAEQREACRILGVKDVVFLGYDDAMLVPDLNLRREMVRVIRRLKPDVVICGDPTVRFIGNGYLNHPDHRAVAEATLDAIYPAARDRMTFPEVLAEGLEPHKVREVYLSTDDKANIAIDITDYMELKIQALKAHVSQMGDWDPSEEIKGWARQDADRFPGHGTYSESYKYLKLD